MAARIRKTHQDDVRAKIQATQIVNRLVNCGMGKVKLTQVQVNALKAVLDKVLSNAPTVIAGDRDNPLYFDATAVVGKLLPELAGGDTPTPAGELDQG